MDGKEGQQVGAFEQWVKWKKMRFERCWEILSRKAI